MPASKGLPSAVLSGKEIGCTAVQVFTSSPQQWKGKNITQELAEQFAIAREKTKIDFLVSHDSYLINLCAPNMEIREKSVKALVKEMERCEILKIPFTVSHMGSHLGEGEEIGLKELAKTTKQVLKQAPKNVSIAMETTAGQGTNLGYRFEHLAYVIDKNNGDSRLVVCLDTCHIFAAGYDIRDKHTYDSTMEEFGRIIGFERLKVIHANDSKQPFASRKDRHEHIGQGQIGEYPFRRLVNDKRVAHAPLIVETPEAETMHATNVAKLFSFESKVT